VSEQIIGSRDALLEVVVYTLVVEDGVNHGLGAANIRLLEIIGGDEKRGYGVGVQNVVSIHYLRQT
jgi:hypothetical protein